MGIIQQLKSAGSVSVYHDYRAGHSTDLASTKNGTLTAIQFSKGANFDGATSGISIGDLGNIRAIFFSVKPNNLTGSILELINNSAYVTYSAGVLATTGFTSSTIYVNGVAGTTISSDKPYLVCITDSANIAAATTNLGEANGTFFNGNIGCFLALSVMPTETQISQITAELQNTVWPSKPTSKAFPSLSVPRNGLVGEWLLDNVSGVTAPDTSGSGYNGTLVGGIVSEQSIIGKACKFDEIDGYINLGDILNTVINAGFSFSCWIKTADVPPGGFVDGIFSKEVAGGADRIFIAVGNTGTIKGFWRLDGTTIFETDLGTTVVNNNVWHHIAVTVNRSGNFTAYVDGVVENAPQDISASSALTFSNSNACVIGARKQGTAGELFNGLIKNCGIYNRILSAQEIKAIYEQGKSTIPLKTDFGATQSTADEGSVIGQYISNLPFQCAETTGRWQVSTSTINGTLVKTIKNTTNGKLYLDMSKFGNTTEAAYGSWEFWIKKIDAAAFSMNLMNTISTFDTAGNNGYALQFSDTEAMQFLKVANGVTSQLMAKNAAITADTWFKVKLTRTSAGSWSLYFNDILVGDLGVGTNPVTENTYTTAQYLVFECLTAANIEIALADVGGNYSFNKTYFA